MKALFNVIGEIFFELVKASVDVVSTANIGGMADTNYQGGNNQ